MFKQALAATAATVLLASASPASAAVYFYNMDNGDVLDINTTTQMATLVGPTISAVMSSPDFASFPGGNPAPFFTADLASLTGQQFINGAWYTPNPGPPLPKRLYMNRNTINLFTYWGDPIQETGHGPEYVAGISTSSAGSSSVPAPNAAGLFALALGGLAWFAGRRKRIPQTAMQAA